jgi:hypothetical protein
MTIDGGGLGDDVVLGFGGRNAASHPNPMYDYLTGFVPRKLKDLFKWAEYLGFHSAHVYGVVRKFGEYPITRFIYESNSEEEKTRHKKLFEEDLRLKGFLTLVSYDVWLYGNSFVSVYEPIKRELVCPHCGTKEDIAAATYKFNLSKLQFTHDCKQCRRKAVLSKVEDHKLRDPTKIALIRWDPKLIDIEHNRVTGESVYYYQIPRDDVSKVRGGNKTHINHMPLEILRAMQERKTFEFAPGALYHLKMPGPAGVQAQWGFPPITSAIKNFLFTAVLRRANEAIALEHITPFRIIHPLAASGAGDPLTTIPLDRWKSEMERNMRLFRRDPLRIQFSPVPVGVQNIGGEGRALLTLGELQEAEKSIVLSLGVPMEFLSGGLGQTRGEITLRMIENQLQTHIENLNALVQWVERKVASFMSWASIRMRLADFKMIDDVENKQLKIQLWQSQLLSNTTMAEMLDVDLDHERKQRREDALADARSEQETSVALQKLQQSISTQAQQQALQNQGGLAYDQQQILAKAQPIAEEMAGYDAGTRRSRLDSLKGEDFVMYCMTKELLEQMQQDQTAAMKAQG